MTPDEVPTHARTCALYARAVLDAEMATAVKLAFWHLESAEDYATLWREWEGL